MPVDATRAPGFLSRSQTVVMRALRSLSRSLPEGGKLPDNDWKVRHFGILTLLWLHVPAVVLFGLTVDNNPVHLMFEALPIAASAGAATYLRDRRTASTVATSVGLMTSSAVLVHLSGGVIEAHFHFFVMVGVVVLYQEWWPFLVAIGYVVLHHGVIGSLFPEDVYNHPAAVNGAWKWAVVHGVFILGMSAAGILAWRLNESLRATTAVRERQLAEAQQLAHIGSWEWDLAADRLECSDELYRIFGVARPGRGANIDWFMERVHPDDRQALGQTIEETRQSRSEFAIDFRFTDATGEVRWMHGRGELVADEQSRPSNMRGTGEDITERKRMQAALVKEGVVLRRLLQMVAVAANQATTVEAALEVAIEQVCTLTGWSVGHAFLSDVRGEALTSTGIWRVDEPEQFDAFRQATEATSMPNGVELPGRVLSSAAPAWVTDVTADPNFRRRDAARRSGIQSGFAFPIPVGQEIAGVLEFFSTHSEPVDEQLLEVIAQVGKQLGLVVERTRALEELHVTSERHRTIVETATDAFVEMNQQGIIAEWNHSAEAMFGWTHEEAVGRELANVIIPEELRVFHREGLDRYLATGEGRVVSNRVGVEAVHRDGRRFPVELAVWEVASPTGRFFNAFVRDISQQKQTEEALASARDQALEASRLKSEFLANMSHEIRTPMNGVIGLTGLLLDTRLDEIQRKYAEGVRLAGEALLSIINDILDFSKVEAGKVELEEVDFDLRELVEESVGLLAGPAAAKGLELVNSCHPSLPTAVRGDPVRLRQVLLNLVANAVKFTERGEVVVQARRLEGDEARVVVRFDVVDSGIGIDAASYDRLFVSFSQADTSTTRRYGGTGLGLALVKRLVDLMGGEVGMDSELGGGSTFWFTVPLVQQTAVTPVPATVPSLKGVRALVVDDNATNCLILEQQLTAWGMRPESLQDPRQALGVLRVAAEAGEHYGVALVDVQMPGMDGVEVAELINSDATLTGLPLILLSSAATLGASDRSQAGVALSLMKPVRQSELYDALIRLLARAPDQRAPVNIRHRATGPAAGWRGRVLVAEDNVINQTVAAGTLAKLGYGTDVAANGREAVDALSRHEYEAVLMDCQMPEMDGYEATREIRRREGGDRHIPIIAMTASAMDGDRERCLAAGMDDYIPKPVRGEEIQAALEHWIREAPPGGSTGNARSGSGSVLDPSLLEQLRELGPGDDGGDMFAELVEHFVTQSADRLEELRDAAGRRDWPTLARAAHTQRGSAAVMGAAALASACAGLEAASRTADLGEARKRLQEIDAELERVTTALRLEAQAP